MFISVYICLYQMQILGGKIGLDNKKQGSNRYDVAFCRPIQVFWPFPSTLMANTGNLDVQFRDFEFHSHNVTHPSLITSIPMGNLTSSPITTYCHGLIDQHEKKWGSDCRVPYFQIIACNGPHHIFISNLPFGCRSSR